MLCREMFFVNTVSINRAAARLLIDLDPHAAMQQERGCFTNQQPGAALRDDAKPLRRWPIHA
jgi:hypothetical protein